MTTGELTLCLRIGLVEESNPGVFVLTYAGRNLLGEKPQRPAPEPIRVWLAKVEGEGPPVTRLGERLLRYSENSLRDWLASRTEPKVPALAEAGGEIIGTIAEDNSVAPVPSLGYTLGNGR